MKESPEMRDAERKFKLGQYTTCLYVIVIVVMLLISVFGDQ